MPDIEELLRERLAREADRLEPSPGFPARVRAGVDRSRRSGFRRGLSVAVVVALIGVAVVVLPDVVGDDGDAPDERILVEPGPSASATTTAETPATSPSLPPGPSTTPTSVPPKPVPTTQPIPTNRVGGSSIRGR